VISGRVNVGYGEGEINSSGEEGGGEVEGTEGGSGEGEERGIPCRDDAAAGTVRVGRGESGEVRREEGANFLGQNGGEFRLLDTGNRGFGVRHRGSDEITFIIVTQTLSVVVLAMPDISHKFRTDTLISCMHLAKQ
jgi:hypothetical protein